MSSLKEIQRRAKVLEYTKKEGYTAGQQSCAASPWTYRTDTGDEHGKVVETAELPERDILAKIDALILPVFLHWKCHCFYVVIFKHKLSDGTLTEKLEVINPFWLRKHLKAFAKINEVE